MSPAPGPSRPLLAICVPTFNRASSLRNLFRSLGAVKVRFGDEIEICISNNGSTDDTRVVIEAFGREHSIDVRHQASNIGGTLNIIAVAGQMRASWGIWCGDDDELDPDAIGCILARLRTLAPNTWVLVDCADLDGRGQYLRHFAEGDYGAAEFRRGVLRSGLDPFGFMGVHVFPSSAVPLLQALQIIDAQPWPHMAGLLRHIVQDGSRVHTLREIAILQAKGGAKLFWSGGDLARIRIAKLRIISRAQQQTTGHPGFLRLLMLREMYSLGSIKAMAAWKLYEGEDYDRLAVRAYLQASSWMGVMSLLALPYALLAVALRVVPHALYAAFFRLIGQDGLLIRYQQLKRELGVFDGIKRGI